MKSKAVIPFILFLLLADLRADNLDFPPIADRYDEVPSAVADVISTMKKLQAKTEIGVNFIAYNTAVEEAYPAVRVLVESQQTDRLPELQWLLSNAIDCHLKVRELWKQKIGGDSPLKKYQAGMTFITAQPVLWKVAKTNVTAASNLIQSPLADKEVVRDRLLKNVGLYTLDDGLKQAAEESAKLNRKSRANLTGFEVPRPNADYVEQDISSLAFSPDDYQYDVNPGKLNQTMPRIFDEVPPAVQEGCLKLFTDDGGGSVTILIYQDPEAARTGFEILQKGLGKNMRLEKGLGDDASTSGMAGLNCSLVMRRGSVLVHMSEASGSLIAARTAASKIDTRLGEFMPLDDPSKKSVSISDPDRESNWDWRSLLFDEDELDEEITIGNMKVTLPPIFLKVPLSEEQGIFELSKDGKSNGFVAFLRYKNDKDSKVAFKEMASGIGRFGGRVSGVGQESYASRKPLGSAFSIVFRREGVVIYARIPVKSQFELVKFGRATDKRVRAFQRK